MLTDGYLKKNFRSNVISKGSALNMLAILNKFGFNPARSIPKREKYGWQDLYVVRLTRPESALLNNRLNKILIALGYPYTFKEIKYGPDEI